MVDLKITHLNHSDINGGAARAAYRIHQALRDFGIDSHMGVNVATLGDWTVQGPANHWSKLAVRVRPYWGRLLRRTLRTQNPIIHSPAFMRSGWPRRLNVSDTDIIHLHWVAEEMLSIADIARINKPIVWTLHDMWAFCGAEHYTDDYRWRDGYNKDNRPTHESGFDLNRWTWQRKRKHWQRPMHIVTPSRWLADGVRQSVLMRDWPISVIPNSINTDRWQPLNPALARELLGLPSDVPLLLFGAMGGGQDPRKGFDLLTAALSHLRGEIHALHLVVFGQLAPREPPNLGFPIHYTGHLHDDLSLRALYSAADVLVVPSRQEAFGQTASEAHACGTPVVAFNIGGLPDIVEHQHTGYLAQPFDTEGLAQGIAWVLAHSESASLRTHARARAVERFANPVVAAQYRAVYSLVG